MTDTRQTLQKILDTAELGYDACAAALGMSRHILEEMLSGQREIPDSLIPLLSAVLGVSESALSAPSRSGRPMDVVPAIWYKLRSDELKDADREYVLSLRQLAFYQHELELVTDTRASGWKSMFDDLRRQTDPQASPTEQGRQAARLFRRVYGLDRGAMGIGEVIRPFLQTKGILLIETSAPEAALEGCSFFVGPSGAERPCLFANSYRTTWFRRNRILMHELGHAIFDVESSIATLDFKVNQGNSMSIEEQRADSFAQEALVPFEVLRNIAQRFGIDWSRLDPQAVARIVAATHVEQRLLAKAALEGGLVESDVARQVESMNIAAELKPLSTHALTTAEFIRTSGLEGAGVKRRTTTTGPRKLLLPVKYVGAVLEAMSVHLISRSKAARMLMIDEYELGERFPSEQLAYAD